MKGRNKMYCNARAYPNCIASTMLYLQWVRLDPSEYVTRRNSRGSYTTSNLRVDIRESRSLLDLRSLISRMPTSELLLDWDLLE
jgi:hypothetical protein